MVGAVIAILPLPFTTVVLSAAVAWLGFHLFAGGEAAEAQASPRVRQLSSVGMFSFEKRQ
jgi:hypothetical protein